MCLVVLSADARRREGASGVWVWLQPPHLKEHLLGGQLHPGRDPGDRAPHSQAPAETSSVRGGLGFPCGNGAIPLRACAGRAAGGSVECAF